jgi:hypothetical protein
LPLAAATKRAALDRRCSRLDETNSCMRQIEERAGARRKASIS